MDEAALTEENFYTSYEVMLFNRVVNELLLIDYALSSESNSTELQKHSPIKTDRLNNIWTNLNNILKNEKKEAERILPSSELKNFQEVLFILVSIIDEFFVRKEKNISEYWSNNLFEHLYFNTRTAGSRIFEKLEEMIENKTHKKRNIVYLYLMSLTFGFRGKYYGDSFEDVINNYKRSLFGIIFNKSAYQFESQHYCALSDSIDSLEDKKTNPIQLSNNSIIYKTCFILIFIYIIGSYGIIYSKKTQLETKFEKINNSLEYIQKWIY